MALILPQRFAPGYSNLFTDQALAAVGYCTQPDIPSPINGAGGATVTIVEAVLVAGYTGFMFMSDIAGNSITLKYAHLDPYSLAVLNTVTVGLMAIGLSVPKTFGAFDPGGIGLADGWAMIRLVGTVTAGAGGSLTNSKLWCTAR